MNKHDAIIKYFKEYPQLYSWLYFNAIVAAPGNVALLLDNVTILKEYIDGSKQCQYVFNINMCKEYDNGTTEINKQAVDETLNFIEWIEENNKKKYFPDFNNCKIDDIEVLTDIPIMTVDQENRRANYLIQLRVNYKDYKGVEI